MTARYITFPEVHSNTIRLLSYEVKLFSNNSFTSYKILFSYIDSRLRVIFLYPNPLIYQ